MATTESPARPGELAIAHVATESSAPVQPDDSSVAVAIAACVEGGRR